MTGRRILIFAGVLLILFLGMYSWNQRTRHLDDLASDIGLELTGAVLKPLRAIEDTLSDFWNRYFDLVNVRAENLELQARVAELESRLLAHGEELAELKRLRVLLRLPVDNNWRPLGARVLAGRMGPNAVLDSIVISRGYTNGGRPGTPLVTHQGLVGRVLRASAHTATVLLITDPGSRIAVFSQQSRAMGILTGRGIGRPMEVNFVGRGSQVAVGEVLITSGLDGKFPKGIPVARVTSVAPSDYTQFLAVEASPMVDLRHLEEALLLEPISAAQPAVDDMGPPIPGTRAGQDAP
ncbi:MAG: rod shape-determining protein MreC [Desulfovibrionaceae bacterium]|nr:rod shape-determining protein MreC [Desulfovibrionaceae bacterium]